MPLTFEQVLMFLFMLVAAMLIIVLYHAIFIMVDVRKMTRRLQDLTEELQAVIMKPVSVADQAMDYFMDFLKQKQKKSGKKHDAVDSE